jgi:hypothetical protein
VDGICDLYGEKGKPYTALVVKHQGRKLQEGLGINGRMANLEVGLKEIRIRCCRLH